jgi:UDP-galactopyranose mutase
VSKFDYLITGAGLFGSVFANEMNKRGKRCLVIEKRSHIGGNCYTNRVDDIDIHTYGPHIFRTNNETIWNYINQVAGFNEYRHTCRVSYKGKFYSFPINLETIQQVYGTSNATDALKSMHADRIPCQNTTACNLEEWCLSQIGPRLYEMFIKGYTEKHWNRSARELDSAIIKRLPIREIRDDNYYSDRFQGIPVDGYTKIFSKLLDRISVRTGVDYFDHRDYWDMQAHKIVFTGEIDRFFDFQFGRLQWRSLRFETTCHDTGDYQGRSIVNYTEKSIPYTRTVEHKHFNIERTRRIPVTHVTHEYPAEVKDTGEAYYPVPTRENRNELQGQVIFGGRLANYVYIDMAPTIQMALNSVQRESPGQNPE